MTYRRVNDPDIHSCCDHEKWLDNNEKAWEAEKGKVNMYVFMVFVKGVCEMTFFKYNEIGSWDFKQGWSAYREKPKESI